MVSLFNKTIKNVLSNYIPHETITCDDKDPPWFNKNIKQLIQEKQYMKKLHFKRQKSSNFRQGEKSLKPS